MSHSTFVPFSLAGDVSERLNNPRLPVVAREFHAATVQHSTFQKGLEALASTHAMSGLEGAGMIIEGEPGLGKTTLLNRYVKDIYQLPEYQPTDTLTPLPVLKVYVPGRPTVPRVIEKLLMASHHVKTSSRNTKTIESRLHTLIRNQGVEMIIFDEFQHLLRTEKYTHDTLNFLKVLADDYKLAIVFAGLPRGLDILKDHKEIEERLSFDRVTFQPFDITTARNAQDYARYIKGLENKLEEIGVQCIALTEEVMLQRMLLATQGKPRFINRLFMRLLIRLSDRKPLT